jgi:endonuclease/exonuclease/phosphatase (EEP) superfamily protein YafD
MDIFLNTLHIVAFILVLATLIPLAYIDHWVVRGFDFPRLQIAIGLTLTSVTQAGFMLAGFDSYVSLLIVSLVALAWQLRWIMEYLPIFPKEVKSLTSEAGVPIKIMTSNVLMTNRNANKLLELVQQYQPHVLVTLETDQWWEDQLAKINAHYPYRVACPLDNLYGIHLYSQWPLHHQQVNFLVEDDKPSIFAELETPIGDRIRCHFLHPAPPSPSENETSTERDAELLVVAKDLAEDTRPILVTGDLNDVAWSRTTRHFRKISRLLDPRVGRGMFNTFHADYWCFRWPLDHLFHSKHFYFKCMKRLPNIGSDHFPLYSEIVYLPEGQSANDRLDVTLDDHAWADEKIAATDAKQSDVPS